MKKIFYIMGRSGSGKDTIYKELLKSEKLQNLNLKEIILHTTRPMRLGETQGKEYYFVSDEEFEYLKSWNKFIETREYNVVDGIWKYGTCEDSLKDDGIYIGIGTLISYEELKKRFPECTYPVYISVEENILYRRTVERANGDSKQNIKEIQRRFNADSKDFSEENILRLNIEKRFENNKNLNDCVKEIIEYILAVV